jgi:teichuronic acid biosynthesis glycosyltransferase TuaH
MTAGIALVASVPHAGHRLYEQRLATALSRHALVAYLDPPAAPRSVGAWRSGGRPADGGRTLVQPAVTVPFSRRLGLRGARDAAARRAARRVLQHLGGEPSAVVYTGRSGALDVLRPSGPRVLLVKDDYVVGADLLGRDPAALEGELAEAVGRADAVVAVSPVLRDRLRRFDVEAHVIPAGCHLPDLPHRDGPSDARPRAVFLGGVSPRVLPEHLTAVLDAGCDLTVVGGLARTVPDQGRRAGLEAVLADPRVEWRGQVGPDEVDDALGRADVGLVPYSTSSFNAASFPLKTLEYLAAGLPVVSTPLPAVDWLGSDQVLTRAEASSFGAAALQAGLGATAEVRARCRSFAEGHTWERRASAWLDALGQAEAVPELPETGG